MEQISTKQLQADTYLNMAYNKIKNQTKSGDKNANN